MNKLYVGVLNDIFNIDGPDWVYDDPNCYTITKVSVPWNKGTKGLTTCPDHQKEINRKTMINRFENGLDYTGGNNPRAKTWKIVYEDGREIIVKALQRWADNNGYSRSGVKNLAYGKWNRYRDLVAIVEVAQGA